MVVVIPFYHQPYAYDQLTALYHRYTVTSCKYECDFINMGTNPCDVIGVFSTASISGSAAPHVDRELPYSKYAICTSNQAMGQTKIRGGISVSRLVGLKTLGQRNTSYSGASNGPPSEKTYLRFNVNTLDRSSSENVRGSLKLTISVCFFDRTTLAQS